MEPLLKKYQLEHFEEEELRDELEELMNKGRTESVHFPLINLNSE